MHKFQNIEYLVLNEFYYRAITNLYIVHIFNVINMTLTLKF